MPAPPNLKQRLKARFSQWPGFEPARFLYGLFRVLRSRKETGLFVRTHLLLRRPPKELFQPFGNTSAERYPVIFRKMAELLEDGPERRVISFGCSTGEEVFSLRRRFAQARILGLDVNSHSIAVCRSELRRHPDVGVEFAVASSTAGLVDASCDAILAMAVFRHGDLNQKPYPVRCDHRIHFADFEVAVRDFARCLKPGGLLILRHSMFRFADTDVARQFEVVLRLGLNGSIPLYGRDDCLLSENQCPEVIFRKVRD